MLILSILSEPQSHFPDFKLWPQLSRFRLFVTSVDLARQILAAVPTSQWRDLQILVTENGDDDQACMLEGLEEEDWQQLTRVGIAYCQFRQSAAWLKNLPQLERLAVYYVPDDVDFWPQFLQWITPQSHPNLQSIHLFDANFQLEVNLPDEWQSLLQWPALTLFPGSQRHPQCRRNRIRQARLVDLAAHPLAVRSTPPLDDRYEYGGEVSDDE